MKRQRFLTEYRIEQFKDYSFSKYASYLLAENKDEAEAIAERKKETIISESLSLNRQDIMSWPETIYERIKKKHDPIERMIVINKLQHQIFFLLGKKSNTEFFKNLEVDAFSDVGFLHQILHMSLVSLDSDTQFKFYDRTILPALQTIRQNNFEMFLTEKEYEEL